MHNNVVSWFRQLLSRRTQVFLVNRTTSNPVPISSEVPQGGVFGSLLFTIYINSVSTQIDMHSSIMLFANDTKNFR